MNLTQQQHDIINSTGNIRINAVAGSGKTTTIIQYAASRPRDSRILYLAFNKSVKMEAARRFAELGLMNVQVETAHSLAYRHIVHRNGFKVCPQNYKTHEIAELLGLKAHGEKHGEYILASHIHKFLTYFCNSTASKVQELNYLDIVIDPKAKALARALYRFIELGTRNLLARMNSGEMEVTHDFYLKLFQLSRPVLDYDYILFDEGQDASPAMLDIFLNQQAVKVIVGDAHQQIYAWRHAVNSLARVDFKNYHLSTSFRFGEGIAQLAMQVLHMKNILGPCDAVQIKGEGKPGSGSSRATIARSNLGLLVKAISFIREQPQVQQIYFEGNIHSYTYADDGASLYDVLNLYNGAHGRIRDKLIRSMRSMAELEEYIEKTEDAQLGMMVEIVQEYGNEIFSLIRELKKKHVGDGERSKAEMIFSTVHRAKGMEYDEVELAEDFITEAKLERQVREQKKDQEISLAKLNEEINLLYVAVTRAKGKLHIPETLLPKNFIPCPEIRVINSKNENLPEPGHARFNKYSRAFADRSKLVREYSYTEIRRAHKQAYEKWTEESDRELRTLFQSGLPISEIAAHFEKKPASILSRLKKIGFTESNEDL